jgi:hypothetical protein
MRTAIISHKLLPHIIGYIKKLSGFKVLHLHKKFTRQRLAMQQQTENLHMASLREWKMNQALAVEFIWQKQGRMIVYDIMKDRCNDMVGEICT